MDINKLLEHYYLPADDIWNRITGDLIKHEINMLIPEKTYLNKQDVPILKIMLSTNTVFVNNHLITHIYCCFQDWSEVWFFIRIKLINYYNMNRCTSIHSMYFNSLNA